MCLVANKHLKINSLSISLALTYEQPTSDQSEWSNMMDRTKRHGLTKD